MKILLLPAYFFPENISSSYLDSNFREYLAERGHEMVLITPVPTRGINKNQREHYKKVKYEEQLNGSLKIHRFSMFDESRSVFLRAVRYTLCSLFQLIISIQQKGIDFIHVSSTPPIQGALASILKKIKKVPFVYWLQDIFPDSMVSTGITSNKSLLWKIGRIIEDFTYANADKIIVISQDFKRNLMDKGIPENKIEVIYNWVDETKVINISRDKNILFDIYKLDRKNFYITYCGNLGLTQNFEFLIEIADILKAYSDIIFVLIGDGLFKSDLIKSLEEKVIKNVLILPFQPNEYLSNVFSLGDVGLVISKPGVGKNSVPSKTWSIMSAERPVLANFDRNELQQIIEENNCGIFTQAGDKVGFKKAVLELYNDREKCRQLGLNGRRFILENLTKEKGLLRHLQIIEQLKPK